MSKTILSPNGILASGSGFIDLTGSRPPSSFEYISGAGLKSVTPDVTSFSLFHSWKSARKNIEGDGDKGYRAGDHVALHYINNENLFSIVIVRCDTWAVQWAISAFTDRKIVNMVCLTAHLVAGVTECLKTKKRQIFVASRLDTTHVGKSENREWRHFIANPRFIEFDCTDGIAANLVPIAADSFIVLTDSGALVAVKVDLGAFSNKSEALTTCTILGKKMIKGASPKSQMLCSSCEGANYLVVYEEGTRQVDMISFALGDDSSCHTQALKISSPLVVSRVEVVGSHHIMLSLKNSQNNSDAIQFVSLIPGEPSGKIDLTMLNVVPLNRALVASYYSSNEETHTLIIASSLSNGEGGESLLHSLSQATFSFSEGPYSEAQVATAQWTAVHDPYRHYGPRVGGDSDEGMSDLYKDFAAFESIQRTSGGASLWVPLRLFYALANYNEKSATLCDVALFCIKTAPYIHTRLIKQWHNATNGLKSLLDPQSRVIASPFLVPWNPRHMRRALRLMTQSQLGAIFSSIASELRNRNGTDAVSFCDAATAACDMALQIITLSRQMGVVLQPSDVSLIAALLRASRELGHDCLQYANRIGLLLDSSLQQRVVKRLLSHTDVSPAANEEEEASAAPQSSSLSEEYYGIPDEMRTGRTLHTRYTANTWAQHLNQNAETHNTIIDGANKYLSVVAQSAPAGVCDWQLLGVQRHADAVFSQYESSLVKFE